MTRRSAAALANAFFGLFASLAYAQSPDYPRRPVHLLVPYVAGGATDVFARIVAEAMSVRIGQPMVVENKPGGGTVMATGMVAKGTPDGYTLLLSTLVHSINASLHKSLPYDPIGDFEFVGKFGQLTFMVMVQRELGVDDLSGLLALMRANPTKYQYGSAGVGSPMHLGVELLKASRKSTPRMCRTRARAPSSMICSAAGSPLCCAPCQRAVLASKTARSRRWR